MADRFRKPLDGRIEVAAKLLVFGCERLAQMAGQIPIRQPGKPGGEAIHHGLKPIGRLDPVRLGRRTLGVRDRAGCDTFFLEPPLLQADILEHLNGGSHRPNLVAAR